MNKLLIICGPTATGKTALALQIARAYHAKCIAADSRHVYQGLDILTGKDLPHDGTKIWATNLVTPHEPYSVAQYQQTARAIISAVHKRGAMAILVGGTGLYIWAVVGRVDTARVPQNSALRTTLSSYSIAQLQAKLRCADGCKWQYMNRSDRMNPPRLIRAIEVASWKSTHPMVSDQAPGYDALWIGLSGPLEVLKKNIKQRVLARFAHGVVGEVKSFDASESGTTHQASTSLGLSVIRRCIAGQLHKDEVVGQWTQEEYAYVKRQLTWFRKVPDIHWFDITKKNYHTDIGTLVREWYTRETI